MSSTMSRPERGRFDAWLRGGQTVGHTFDMVMEVVRRLVVGWAVLGVVFIALLSWRATAIQGQAALYVAEAWGLKSWGKPLPQTLTIAVAGQPPVHVPVGEVWTDPTVGPPAHEFMTLAGNCAMAWLIATALWVMLAGKLFSQTGKEKIKTRQIRGQTVTTVTDLIGQIDAFNKVAFAEKAERLMKPFLAEGYNPEQARKELRASDLVPPKLAGVPYPCDTEMQHTMICGGPGSGKTEAIHQLLASIRSKGQRAIIFDPELDFIRSHYDEKRDTILNPFDARSPGWSPFNDAVDRPDWDRLGHAVFKDPRSGDPYWVGVARALFSWTGYQLRRRNPNVDLPEALDMLFGPTKTLKSLLEGTPAAKHLEGTAGARVSSLESVLTAGVEPLIYLYGSTNRFSVREWTNRPAEASPGGFLFLSAPESHMDAIRPLLGFWSEIAVSSILSRHDTEREPTWIVLDEFHSAGRIDKLADGPQRLRKYGGAVVLGFQQVSQLQDLYGPDKSRTIMGQCATKLILRAGDFDTAEMMSEQIGRRVMRRVEENTSYGANSIRDGVGLAPKEELEPICLPENVMNFPSLQGIVRVSNARASGPFPVAPIKIGLVPRTKSNEGFVPKDSDPVDDYLARLRSRIAEVAREDDEGREDGEGGEIVPRLSPPGPNNRPPGGSSVRAENTSSRRPPSVIADPPRWGDKRDVALTKGIDGQPAASVRMNTLNNMDTPRATTLGRRVETSKAPNPRRTDDPDQSANEAQTSLSFGENEGDEDDDDNHERPMEPRRRDLPTEEGVMHRRREDEAESLRFERINAERRNDAAPVRVSVMDKEGEILIRSVPTDQMDTMSVATDRDIMEIGHHTGLGDAFDILASAVLGNAVSLSGHVVPESRSELGEPAEVEQSRQRDDDDGIGPRDEIRLSSSVTDELEQRPELRELAPDLVRREDEEPAEKRAQEEFTRAAGEVAKLRRSLQRNRDRAVERERAAERDRDDYGLEMDMDR